MADGILTLKVRGRVWSDRHIFFDSNYQNALVVSLLTPEGAQTKRKEMKMEAEAQKFIVQERCSAEDWLNGGTFDPATEEGVCSFVHVERGDTAIFIVKTRNIIRPDSPDYALKSIAQEIEAQASHEEGVAVQRTFEYLQKLRDGFTTAADDDPPESPEGDVMNIIDPRLRDGCASYRCNSCQCDEWLPCGCDVPHDAQWCICMGGPDDDPVYRFFPDGDQLDEAWKGLADEQRAISNIGKIYGDPDPGIDFYPLNTSREEAKVSPSVTGGGYICMLERHGTFPCGDCDELRFCPIPQLGVMR